MELQDEAMLEEALARNRRRIGRRYIELFPSCRGDLLICLQRNRYIQSKRAKEGLDTPNYRVRSTTLRYHAISAHRPPSHRPSFASFPDPLSTHPPTSGPSLARPTLL